MKSLHESQRRMTSHTLAVAVLIALVSCTSVSTIRAQAFASDSVNVLLFANDPTRTLVIDGRSLAVAGLRGPAERPLRLRASASGVLLPDGAVRRSITIGSTGPVTLSSSKRSRRMRGVIEVTAGRDGLRAVVRMPLRDYLLATLAAEGSERDPYEYLVALAVLQRNYVLSHRGRHAPDADVCDNTHCQIADMRSEHRIFARAADGAGRLDLSAGSARPCYYSASCGGGTITPAQIWRRPEAGYTSVDCEHCRSSRWYRWTRVVVSSPAVERIVRAHPPAPFVDEDFKIRVGRLLGFSVVPSNSIDRIERRGRSWLIAGRGFGHRVGLCQDGARALARRGWDATAILRYYFPSATAVERSARK